MQFPPEEVRCALGERIGLTEQQVQVQRRHSAAWFYIPASSSSTCVYHAGRGQPLAAMQPCTPHGKIMGPAARRQGGKPAALSRGTWTCWYSRFEIAAGRRCDYCYIASGLVLACTAPRKKAAAGAGGCRWQRAPQPLAQPSRGTAASGSTGSGGQFHAAAAWCCVAG